MIAKDCVTAWRFHAPWVSDHQVEQDLVISRALTQIFSVAETARRLAFRGGTALYKLYLQPAARYSEDIDLVQAAAEPIGDTFDAVRSVLDPWLGSPRRDLFDLWYAQANGGSLGGAANRRPAEQSRESADPVCTIDLRAGNSGD